MKGWSELPRPLLPWAPYLQLLPHEQTVPLAPLVQRLDIAIGPLRVHARGGAGEPDGFDGIARRGSYDRLLLSEWLMADEMPDEFTRRAIMSEHAFLQIARQEPAGARVSFALFDAGPSQIGAPRIAHLAALIVLARRADAAGARLEWGIVQRPDEPLRSGVSAAGLAALFRARCAFEPTSEHFAKWKERLKDGTAYEERWVIGGEPLFGPDVDRAASYLILQDRLTLGERLLDAEIRCPGRSPTYITLDLPDDAACVRLFREPSHDAERIYAYIPVSSRAPTSNLLFLPGGSKLAGRLSRNQLAAYPVPNSPWSGAGKLRSIQAPSRNPIAAVGRIGKKYVVATITDEPGLLQIEWVGQKSIAPYRFTLPPSVPAPQIRDESPVEPLFWQTNAETGSDAWTLSLAGTLLHVEFRESDTPVATVVCAPVTAVVAWPGGAIDCVGQRNGGWWGLARGANGSQTAFVQFESVADAFFGCGGWIDRRRVTAVLTTPSLCDLYSCGTIPGSEVKHRSFAIASGRAVGALSRGTGAESDSAVAVLLDNRRTVEYRNDGSSGTILTAEYDIEQIAVSPYIPGGSGLASIAYLNAKRQLVVYSMTFNANVLTYQFPDPAVASAAGLSGVPGELKP